MSDHVFVTLEGAVQIIRLNRLAKKNALTRAMYHAISQALKNANADDAIRVNVIFGHAGAFCAGNDLQDFMQASQSQGSFGSEIIEFLHILARNRKPLLSGVDGLAIGIGTTLNLHCDLTFATPRSVFHTPFVDLGLVPEAGSSLLGPKIMGYQRAFALLAMGEAFSAEQAYHAGLVYRIVTQDELEVELMKTAHILAAKPQLALQQTRDLLRSADEPLTARINREAQIFAEQLKSAETAQAISAFFSRKA